MRKNSLGFSLRSRTPLRTIRRISRFDAEEHGVQGRHKPTVSNVPKINPARARDDGRGVKKVGSLQQ